MITHYFHSGFSVSGEDILLIFDYWRGEEGEVSGDLEITPEALQRYRSVVVFISHEHIDHMDPVVFTWKDLPNISYVVSSDMPVGTRGKRMAPGDTYSPAEGVDITAFDSTDLGVSFLVNFQGLKVFHAGDLNFWHWREESTMHEIEEADSEFRKAVAPISKEKIDVAFFPLDPRQGTMFEAGANYFVMSVKPRIMIPMHYFHRADIALDYSRTASSRSTEVIAMPLYGDRLQLDMADDGYLNVRYLQKAEIPEEEYPPEEEEEITEAYTPAYSLSDGDNLLEEDNPFAESDLPITSLSEESEEDS